MTEMIPLSAILPNPEQPRTTFDEAELQGLADSMKANGMVNPIVVERAGKQFILVDGERRVRVGKVLGWDEIEAVVREPHASKKRDRLMKALVANVQRSDLEPMDQARAYDVLHTELGSIQAVVRATGVSTTTIQGRLALLSLSESVQRLFQQGHIPLTNEVIFKFGRLDAATQLRVATTAITRGGTVRVFLRLLDTATRGRPYKRKRAYNKKLQPVAPVREPELVGDHFDALALVPGWQKLAGPMLDTARAVCKECELYEHAGKEICARCPLPAFLNHYQPNQIAKGEPT